MSFIISQTTVKRDFYPAFGVEMKDVDVTVDVIYTCINASVNGEGDIVAQFKIQIDDCFVSGHREFTFTGEYTGVTLDEAENLLKDLLMV